MLARGCWIPAPLPAQQVPKIQQYHNRLIVAAYVDTSANGATLRALFRAYGVDMSPTAIFEGIIFRESSWGVQPFSVDVTPAGDTSGVNVGWGQNRLAVVVARERDRVHGPVDVIEIQSRLLYDRFYDLYHATLTFIEMFRHHRNVGKWGDELLHDTIRSYNAGKRRRDYMKPAVTEYLEVVLTGAKFPRKIGE